MSRKPGTKEKKKPDVLKVSLWLCLIAAMVIAAGLVYYFGGAQPSMYEKIVIYVLLGGAALSVIRLAVWGFSWTRNERVSELGLHIVRFAVILTAVVLCVFAMMSADYSSQYRQSASNELRQQALAARIHLQDILGEELGTEASYYQSLYASMPELLDENDNNAGRHVNLYLFVSPDRQPVGTYFKSMEENAGIFAAGTSSRFGVTASAGYIDRVYRNGDLAFSEYIYGDAGFENEFMSAFVPVFTEAGRPVGVLEVCEPGAGTASLFGFVAIELLLRIVALIAMFSFGFYGVMQLLDIMMRPRSVDRSCRVLSCGREAARPVLFFVSLCAGLPIMLLTGAEEMKNLVTIESLPGWVSGLTGALPICLYMLCFLLGWALARKTGKRITEAPSNISLVIATLCAIALILIKDTTLLADVAIMNEWYIPMALIALCGLCYGVSYRTIGKYQAQSDALFGKDKYAYLCTALGMITGIILGGWLLDASGEPGVKVAMLLLNGAACAVSVILLEDLDHTVEGTKLSESRITSVAGLIPLLVPFGFACAYVWVYITGYLSDNDYSVTARSIIMAAPVIAFCFGNRLRLRSRKSQRSALCLGGVIAGVSYLTMVWTPAPVMAVAACGLLCLAVVFVSAGVYSALLPEERGGAFAMLAAAMVVGVLGFSALSGFYASRLCLLIVAGVSMLMSLLFLATKFPKRIDAPEYRDAIEGSDFAPIPRNDEPKKEEDSFAPAFMPIMPVFESQPEPEPQPEPQPEPASEPEPTPAEEPASNSDFGFDYGSEGDSEASAYDWDKVDVQVTDVMSEFFAQQSEEQPAEEPVAEAAQEPAAPEEPEDREPIIFPDAYDEDSGYNPDGGAIHQMNDQLGTDEGFIDFG